METTKQVEHSKSKIKLKPESLKKNMFLIITQKNGKIVEAYFKKFTFKNLGAPDPKKSNIYRDTLEDIFKEFPGITMDQIFLFLSSSEQDDKTKATLSSIQIKEIEDIRLIAPGNVEPCIRLLQSQISELQSTVKSIQQQVSQLKQERGHLSKTNSRSNSKSGR